MASAREIVPYPPPFPSMEAHMVVLNLCIGLAVAVVVAVIVIRLRFRRGRELSVR